MFSERQHVLELMGQFAEFPETAGGRVPLQRMHRPPQAAGRLRIAGRFLQPHRFVVQLLDEFPRGFEEQLAEFAHPVFGGKGHIFTSTRWYAVPLLLMHHLKFLRQPQQALGMADKQVSLGIQAAIKLLHQPLLLGFVEIHHHVAAENDVVALRQVFGLQIVKVEVHQFLDVLLHRVAVAHFVEVAQAVAIIDSRHLVLAVGGVLRRAQNRIVDVAGQDLHPPGRRYQRLRNRRFERQRIAQIVVRQRIGHQHGQRVGFLSRGTARAPDS